jgi:hypothetical protein
MIVWLMSQSPKVWVHPRILRGLEAALCNSSLDGCKEVFPHGGSFDDGDDNEDRGQDRGEDGQTSDHARFTVVESAGALGNPFLDSGEHFGHSGDEPVVDKEGRMEDDLVDYDSHLYESAMRDQPEATDDSVFNVECHGRDPNTPQVEVCFLLFLLYYIRFFFFSSFVFRRYRLAISVVCLIFIVSMTGIVRYQELVVWMSLH